MQDLIVLIPFAVAVFAAIYMAWSFDRPLPRDRKRLGADAVRRILGKEVDK